MDVRESWLAIMAIKTPSPPKRASNTNHKDTCGEEYHGIPIQHCGAGFSINISDRIAGGHVPSELMSGYK